MTINLVAPTEDAKKLPCSHKERRGKKQTKQNKKTSVIYQMQASQWAMRAKVHMSRKRTAAPYSE